MPDHTLTTHALSYNHELHPYSFYLAEENHRLMSSSISVLGLIFTDFLDGTIASNDVRKWVRGSNAMRWHERFSKRWHGQEIDYQWPSPQVPIISIRSSGASRVGRHSKVAIGLIAIGDIAIGLIAGGMISVGVLAFGAISLGLLAAAGAIAFSDCFSVGAIAVSDWLSIGAIAISSMLSIGAIAISHLALGVIAMGQYAYGIIAIGNHGIGLIPLTLDIVRWVKSWFG